MRWRSTNDPIKNTDNNTSESAAPENRAAVASDPLTAEDEVRTLCVSWGAVLAGVTVALVTQLMLDLIGMVMDPSVGPACLEDDLQLIAMHAEGNGEASSQLRRSSPAIANLTERRARAASRRAL